MAIKAKLTAAEFQALPQTSQGFYVASGDHYVIALEGGFMVDTDPAALLNAKNHEVAARKAVEKELADFKAAQQKTIDDAKAAAAEDARKKALEGGDLAALQKDFDERMAKMQADTAAELAKRDAAIADQTKKTNEAKIMAQASAMAGKISTVPTMMAKEIAARLTVDEAGNVVPLDKTGQISAIFDMEKLRGEFVDNPEYAGIIIGSKASGASGSQVGNPVDTTNKSFNDFSTDDLVKLRRENPDEYNRLKTVRDQAAKA